MLNCEIVLALAFFFLGHDVYWSLFYSWFVLLASFLWVSMYFFAIYYCFFKLVLDKFLSLLMAITYFWNLNKHTIC